MEFPIIYEYGDDEAVGDGVLVDLEQIHGSVIFHGTLVNRMTGHLFHATSAAVEEFDAVGFREYLRHQLDAAEDTAAEGEQRDYLYALPDVRDETVWLIRNETGGWTAMFASDY